MNIKKIDLSRFRNDEHFQFHTEVKELINMFDAEKLNIIAQFNTYKSCYLFEDEAYKKIIKSAITKDIEAASRRRGIIFSGMAGIIKSALKHFNKDVAEAAYRIKILFDTYGNLSEKPLNEATSAIYNFIQELLSKSREKDVEAVHLKEWIIQLEVENKNVESLIMKRDDENSVKTHLSMKECRLELDRAYISIVELINAMILIEGNSKYSAFVDRINTCIDRYGQLLARRKWVKDNEPEDSKAEAPNNEEISE